MNTDSDKPARNSLTSYQTENSSQKFSKSSTRRIISPPIFKHILQESTPNSTIRYEHSLPAQVQGFNRKSVHSNSISQRSDTEMAKRTTFILAENNVMTKTQDNYNFKKKEEKNQPVNTNNDMNKSLPPNRITYTMIQKKIQPSRVNRKFMGIKKAVVKNKVIHVNDLMKPARSNTIGANFSKVKQRVILKTAKVVQTATVTRIQNTHKIVNPKVVHATKTTKTVSTVRPLKKMGMVSKLQESLKKSLKTTILKAARNPTKLENASKLVQKVINKTSPKHKITGKPEKVVSMRLKMSKEVEKTNGSPKPSQKAKRKRYEEPLEEGSNKAIKKLYQSKIDEMKKKKKLKKLEETNLAISPQNFGQTNSNMNYKNLCYHQGNEMHKMKIRINALKKLTKELKEERKMAVKLNQVLIQKLYMFSNQFNNDEEDK